jgi:predicted nucleotidyltransferase
LRILCREAELTGREIARKADLSPRAAQQALQELHAKGIVHRQTVGASYLFSLNKDRYVVKSMLSPLFQSEQGLLDTMIKELREALPHHGIISIIVFGSVARGQSKRGSDLDVMILVGDSIDTEKIAGMAREKNKEFAASFGIPISPYVIRRREFISRFDRKDKLIQNVVKEGRVIFGKYFEEVLAHESEKTPR